MVAIITIIIPIRILNSFELISSMTQTQKSELATKIVSDLKRHIRCLTGF